MSASKNLVANPAGRNLTLDPKRVKWVRTRITELKKIVDGAYLEFTDLLYEAAQGQYFKEWGFDDFEDYVLTELGWQERKGWYFVAIQKKLVIENKVSKEALQKIGWSKASRIASLPPKELEGGKAEKWVTEAENESFLEVEAKVKRAKKNNGEAIERTEEVEVRKFYLYPDQVKNVDLAIKNAKKSAQSDKDGHCLDMICLDFNGSRAEEMDVKLEHLLKGIERVFGVELIATNVKGDHYEIVHGAKLAKKLIDKGIEK
jgi:hypothetical protein